MGGIDTGIVLCNTVVFVVFFCGFRYWQFSQSAVFAKQSLVICLGSICSEYPL